MLKLIDNYPLREITTLQIGGPAIKFVTVSSESELIEALNFAKENNLEFLVIGGGSNLLVSDEGVNKLIIKNNISGIEQEGNILKVKSGTILQDLVNYSIQLGLLGLQKLTGIPGTVGGAVYGNAGAYGQTISDNLIKVTTTNSAGDLETFTKEECLFNYRYSEFKKNKFTILEIYFELESSTTELLNIESQEILEKRLVKYPKGIKCPGSFFKNIVADTLPAEVSEKLKEKIVYGKLPAGSLLEEVEAKGDSLDGIEIASYHANLFINKDNGTAESFYKLAKKYAIKVYEKFGIKLEPEVQLINLPPI